LVKKVFRDAFAHWFLLNEKCSRSRDVTFKYDHKFQCKNCRTVFSVKTKGDAVVEPPLLEGGARTLHCEQDKSSNCFGLIRYVGTTVTPLSLQEYMSYALRFMSIGDGVPSKLECQSAIDKAWADGLQKGVYHADMSRPDDLWESVQAAQARLNREAEARRPKTAQQALRKVIDDGAGRDLRTLAVAFDNRTKKWKTGYSAGLGGLTWSRHAGQIQTAPATPTIAALVAKLNTVNKDASLGREVWVCAEVDAAVKAMKEGSSLSDLSFAAAEYPNGYWRDIEACAHCSQWC
jgi:hypothetical protein